MAGIAISASGPNMAYHGARVAGVATNPLAIAVPGREGRVVSLDMATAVAALGKLMHARNTNTPVPDGWALDDAGEPTNDPMKGISATSAWGSEGFRTLVGNRVPDEPARRSSDRLGRIDGKKQSPPTKCCGRRNQYLHFYRCRKLPSRTWTTLSSALKNLPLASDVDELLFAGRARRPRSCTTLARRYSCAKADLGQDPRHRPRRPTCQFPCLSADTQTMLKEIA